MAGWHYDPAERLSQDSADDAGPRQKLAVGAAEPVQVTERVSQIPTRNLVIAEELASCIHQLEEFPLTVHENQQRRNQPDHDEACTDE